MAAREAKIEHTETGIVVTSPGWFVVNMADCRWTRDDRGGEWSIYGDPEGEFEQYGIGIHVLHPGQTNGLYHSESVQEDFLLLSGECLLLIEEEERHLKAWDFMHFAPGTRHICIGAGDGPCAILMVGARGPGKKLHYPVTELAVRYGVAAPEETDDARQAYRATPRNFQSVKATWPI
ncbi:MAG TPA: cupin domain-containing protein [Gaiellaceae bacterium]|nr:cupin domain-containing protein [Gaiellaceae bacterium]